jgi:hypothetical protein
MNMTALSAVENDSEATDLDLIPDGSESDGFESDFRVYRLYPPWLVGRNLEPARWSDSSISERLIALCVTEILCQNGTHEGGTTPVTYSSGRDSRTTYTMAITNGTPKAKITDEQRKLALEVVRPNLVKQTMLDNKLAFSFGMRIAFSTEIPLIAKRSGYTAVLMNLEHMAMGMESMKDIAVGCLNVGCAGFRVRVVLRPFGSPQHHPVCCGPDLCARMDLPFSRLRRAMHYSSACEHRRAGKNLCERLKVPSSGTHGACPLRGSLTVRDTAQ